MLLLLNEFESFSCYLPYHSSCDTVVVEKSIWQGFSEVKSILDQGI